MKRLVVAVDGPSSAGKGTVARQTARALGYRYVDTGAMYRAIGLLAGRQGRSLDDGPALGELAASLVFDFEWDGATLRVIVDGEDLTASLRTSEVGHAASAVSRHAEVRAALLDRQRALAAEGGVVMDGRDIGTVVLPDADVKVFLDAALPERARRRHAELVERGEPTTREDVERAIEARDAQDRQRPVAPLRQAEDAVRVDTTSLSVAEAVTEVLRLVATRANAH